jgi:ribonucleoside-triphosphate reductase
LDRTEKETYQGMEIVVHNLNTMHSRAGAQVPFSSLNYGTDTSAEGRMVIKNILLALDAGMGDGETPIFPIHIFKVKDGINGKPGDPNYDLFKLSIRVSAKRLFPNWVFLDAPFNAQYYKPGDPDTEAATMGCRTRVVGNTFDPQREIFTGRGNLSFISLNLPRLGLKHRNDGNLEAFFEELDEKINMMFDCLLQRFEVQAKRQAKNFPFLIGQGVWIDGESLSPEDEVRDVIKHGTLSIGFIGLAECLKALLGVHHGESEQAQKLGLEIVGRMRAKADAKSKETGLNFSVIGSPAEGLSGRFIRMDRKVFGSIAGVTDRDYYTNSNHVPVYYPISAARKIDIEAPYHALENGGHITYVEVDGDPLNNLEAMEQIVEHMKTRGIGYGSINHPVDRDPVCGYTGIIGDTCPRCGRHDGEAISEKVLKAIRKRITKDNRSEEERIESSDRIPNVIL